MKFNHRDLLHYVLTGDIKVVQITKYKVQQIRHTVKIIKNLGQHYVATRWQMLACCPFMLPVCVGVPQLLQSPPTEQTQDQFNVYVSLCLIGSTYIQYMAQGWTLDGPVKN